MINSKSALNNQRGFTLLESIVTMFILTIVMISLPLIFQCIHSIDRTIQIEEDFEWNLFLIHLRKDMKDANDFRVTSRRLYYVKNNQGIMYEDYGKAIRRRKNLEGHEILLQNIKEHRFSLQGHVITLFVEFENGVKEEAQFTIPRGRKINVE